MMLMICKATPIREDRFCKRHKYLETKLFQEKLDEFAENLNYIGHTCELCNEHGNLNLQCKLFHDHIVSKSCDDLISLAHHNELSLILGYEEMKRITNYLPEFSRYKLLGFDLEKIYMYCAVNCIEKSLYFHLHKENKTNRGSREY